VSGGGAAFSRFRFLTAGAEVGVRAAPKVVVVAGGDLWATERVLPPDIAAESGVFAVWNQIYPFHAGALYAPRIGPIRPYVGVEALGVQYHRDTTGRWFAWGARARGGVDATLLQHVAVRLNVAVGPWWGAEWGQIEQGVPDMGLVPQISGGVVLSP
jgi:hypothetical protein